MVVIEESDSSILGILNDAVPEAERNFANDMITVDVSIVTVNRENVDASFKTGMLYIYVHLNLKILYVVRSFEMLFMCIYAYYVKYCFYYCS